MNNPRFPSISADTAGDVDQFESMRDKTLPIKNRPSVYESVSFNNVFRSSRLFDEWLGYQDITSADVAHTFAYMFYKIKKGIFVKIVDGKLVNFLPFNNVRWVNEYAVEIRFPKEYNDDYERFIRDIYPTSSQTVLPLNEWVANNSIFRFEQREKENDNNVNILRDMFETLCVERKIQNDVEFFINKRDYPVLTRDATEPYNHLYGSRDRMLLSHYYEKYCPVLSMSSNAEKYADVLIPTYEDWARAVYQDSGRRFAPAYREFPKIIVDAVDWKDKKDMAVFRGSSTGAGPEMETNQRLRAVVMSELNPKYIDAKITKWNLRPRKHEFYDTLRALDISPLRDTRVARALTLQQQVDAYKYILTLEGHAAAFRLTYELSCGSVVLLADSYWKMWINAFIQPYVHYVPVANDLSNLLEMIGWCRDNDTKCTEIARNAKAFYDRYCGRNAILDYLQKLLFEISTYTGEYAYLKEFSLDERLISPSSSSSIAKSTFPIFVRSKPLLDGIYRVFHEDDAVSFDDEITPLFRSKRSTIDKVRYRGIYMARKRFNDDAVAEFVHENYVGVKCVNEYVLRTCPNFAYVFGFVGEDTTALYTEYIPGPTFDAWLRSNDFDETTYFKILLIANLALIQAQNACAFVHNDAFPWNVMLQKINKNVKFSYFLGDGNTVIVETNILPIFIDFGKSSAVVYYEKDGRLQESSRVNKFGGNTGIDCISLLASSYKLCRERLSLEALMVIGEFVSTLRHDLMYYAKFGTVLAEPNDVETFSSYDFVRHLLTSQQQPYVEYVDYSDELIMIKNNALFIRDLMVYDDDETLAFDRVLTHLERSSVPSSDNYYLDFMFKIVLARRFEALMKMMPTTYVVGDKSRMNSLVKTYVKDDDDVSRRDVSMIYPIAPFSDEEYFVKPAKDLVPEDIEKSTLTAIEGDWINLMAMFNESLQIRPDIFARFALNDIVSKFDYISSIAKNNYIVSMKVK